MLSSSPLGALQGGHTRQAEPARVPRHYRACSRAGVEVCASAPASSPQWKRPLTCTRIRTDHMCPSTHRNIHANLQTTLTQATQQAPQRTPTAPTRAHTVRGRARPLRKWVLTPPHLLLLLKRPGAWTQHHPLWRPRAPHPAVAEASGTFTALGVLSSGTLNSASVCCGLCSAPKPGTLEEAEPLAAAGPLSQPSSSFSRQVGVHGSCRGTGPRCGPSAGGSRAGGCRPPGVGELSGSHRHVRGEGCHVQDEARLQPGFINSRKDGWVSKPTINHTFLDER